LSVRAYRVVQIIADHSTFDLWNDQSLMDFLDSEMGFSQCLGYEGVGVVNVPIEVLEKALLTADELDLDSDTVTQIKLDISYANSQKDDCVSYYCF
jgi:hypothetical protein